MDESSAALTLAFDRVVGRIEQGPINVSGLEPVARALEGFAHRVVEAGRRVVGLPSCPAALLRRAVDLFRAPKERSAAAAVWKLLFDSWRAPGLALADVRGAGRPRFLRFGDPSGLGGRLDVEMVQASEGDSPSGEAVRLRGTVDGLEGPLVLEIESRAGRRVRVPVRAGGAFATSLEPGAGAFRIALRSGRRTICRTGRIPPNPRG